MHSAAGLCPTSRRVEESWSTVLMEEEKEDRHCLPELGGPSTPWLVYPNGPSMKSQTFCNILEPDKNCFKRIPQMRQKCVKESSHGWLVMLDLSAITNGCSLWNPVTLETIHLPDFIIEDDDDFNLTSCTLSSAPKTDADCMIFFLCSIPLIIYCKLGDTQWTRQNYKIEDGRIDDIISFPDGTIYARTIQDNTAIIDRDNSGCCLSVRLLDIAKPKSGVPGAIRIWTYSFESCGELFYVYLNFSGTDAVYCLTVFKMDFSQMAWVKVESLGGRVFFLTYEGISCVSCFADQQSGLEGDCIYFTLRGDISLYVFDMKDDSISVSLPCPELRVLPWRVPFWFIPMINNVVIETTNDDEEETILTDVERMNVKQSVEDMSMEDGNEAIGWSLFSSLPIDLYHLVATHLTSAVDYMNFRAVCKTWRSVAPPIRWRSPWLMVVQKGVSFFLDPECNSIYRMNTPELFGATIRFSKDGWLLMSEGDFRMFFFDPFTKMRIDLPDLATHYRFESISFSLSPTSSDCVIFGIGLQYASCLIIGWYCLGKENWSYDEIEINGELEPFSLSRSNPVFYNGAFYCLSQEGRLGVFDVNEKWTFLLNRQPCSSTSQNFMVECDGELLSVFLDECGNSTIISRLDRTRMCWVSVKSLSDKMVFLSSSTSIAIETQEKTLQNTFFLPKVRSKNNDVVFYSCETEKYHSFSGSSFSSRDFYGTKEQFFCSWIQPNLVWRNIS